jgi:MSHA pilin protein MshD
VFNRIKRGFSLVESIVFIMVISIGLTGIMSLVISLIRHGTAPILLHQATSIATGYMEEILGKSFYDPATGTVCPAPPSHRIDFDNVCDYQGYFNNAVVTDVNGNTFPDLAGYTVTALITYPATLGVLPNTDVIQVTVTVRNSELPDLVLIGYRTAY